MNTLTRNELHNLKSNGITLVCNLLVIQVVEVTRGTLIECCAVSKGKSSFAGYTPTICVQSAMLRKRTIELELVTRNNRANSILCISKNSTSKTHLKCVLAKASNRKYW